MNGNNKIPHLLAESEKILERVCQAVKEVHLCISTPGGSKHYESCVAARLIYWLDTIFLYGLKKPHKGYWPAVLRIACKSTLHTISQLTLVTTTLGKGRAWLLLSLNEGILEALLATLETQQHVLAQYYHSHALLRDSGAFQILITLVSGLEHVGFDFPIDSPHLDLSILDSSYSKYVAEFEPVDAPLNKFSLSAEETFSEPIVATKVENLGSQPEEVVPTGSIMNSPMVKRRTQIRSSASGSSSNSLATQKRVSFYSNDSDIVENADFAEEQSKPRSSLQRYKSEWILGGEESFPEKSETKKTSSRHLRRFQSEFHLNRTDPQNYSFYGLEREAPEGQEDPEMFHSFRNLSLLKTAEELGKKSQKPWNNSTLSKYAFTLLNSMKTSLEARKPAFSEETKRKVFQQAREKIAWNGLCLPLPDIKVSAEVPVRLNREIESEFFCYEESAESPELKICRTAVDKLGLSSTENYKMFRGYLDFYSGKPRQVNVLLGRKAIYITLGVSHSLLWSAALFDILTVRVKSSYSELCIRSVVSTVTINFLDSNITRQCASYLDLYLNMLGSQQSSIVSAETPEELRKHWNPWLAAQLGDESASLQYVSPVFWEEVVLTSIVMDDKNILGPYKSGYLMYAWNKSRSWQPGYFIIKAGVLYQFTTAQDKVPVFILPLSSEHCKGYGRNFLASRPHAIEIQISQRKCLLLAAASQAEASDWLSTISYSSAVWDETRDTAVESFEVSACGIVLSTHSAVLFRMENGTARRLTSSSISAISFVGISYDENDLFCTVEFACREASEGEGDWVFYFVSSYELRNFLSAFNCQSQVLSEDIVTSLRRRYSAVFS